MKKRCYFCGGTKFERGDGFIICKNPKCKAIETFTISYDIDLEPAEEILEHFNVRTFDW